MITISQKHNWVFFLTSQRGSRQCTPEMNQPSLSADPFLSISSLRLLHLVLPNYFLGSPLESGAKSWGDF